MSKAVPPAPAGVADRPDPARSAVDIAVEPADEAPDLLSNMIRRTDNAFLGRAPEKVLIGEDIGDDPEEDEDEDH